MADMGTIMNIPSVDTRIATELRRHREAQGLSMAGLAERSGVSKAMIAKVEAEEASPTAGLLGRLCAGLGITMSTLMASAEEGAVVHTRAGQYPTWTDPATGMTRRVVAPASQYSTVEVAEITLPPATQVDYPMPPTRPSRQHIVMLSGSMRYTIGDRHVDLGPGDSLFCVIDRPTHFQTHTRKATYLVVQEPA